MSCKQFVTFRIDKALLGVDVLAVREINRISEITPVPHAAEYVRGLANLRGQTVTILDLGVRLGLPRRGITEESHNVVLKKHTVGLLVDSIGDIAQCEEAEVEPPPANIGNIEQKFVEGVVKLQGELLIVLSSAKILEYGEN